MTKSGTRVDEDSLSIRVRNEGDVLEIIGWVSDPAALYLFSGARLTWPLTAAQLNDMTALQRLTAWVVVSSSGRLVGHFDLTLDGSMARLGRVIVNPALRGRRFALAIVDLALGEAIRLGADVVGLNVISTNEPAIRTYQRTGFVTVEPVAHRADVIAMERWLS